mmetsp:Transcript_28267/g.74677  ORF Transcript_28267/g.74677 Transcript_28267/m.74677 type:complete len:231 (+) Transcript_28267:59-751(+)
MSCRTLCERRAACSRCRCGRYADAEWECRAPTARTGTARGRNPPLSAGCNVRFSIHPSSIRSDSSSKSARGSAAHTAVQRRDQRSGCDRRGVDSRRDRRIRTVSAQRRGRWGDRRGRRCAASWAPSCLLGAQLPPERASRRGMRVWMAWATSVSLVASDWSSPRRRPLRALASSASSSSRVARASSAALLSRKLASWAWPSSSSALMSMSLSSSRRFSAVSRAASCSCCA